MTKNGRIQIILIFIVLLCFECFFNNYYNIIIQAQPLTFTSSLQTKQHSIHHISSKNNNKSLNVTVVDYSPIDMHIFHQKIDRNVALSVIFNNLNEYEKIVKNVSNQSELIVFPEYTLYGPGFNDRDRLSFFMEEIPNTFPVLNLCEKQQQSTNNNSLPILQRLSCIAQKYQMYLIVNMGDIQYCKNNDSCPTDNRLMYNTNVIFDKKGNLLNKYHKTHLYFEDSFNNGNGEPIIFKMENGLKIGTIICFDIIFKDPLERLMKEKIDILTYSSWWVNFPSYWNGLGFQQGFSKSFNTILLGASSGQSLLSSGSGVHIYGNSLVQLYNPSIKGKSSYGSVGVEAIEKKQYKQQGKKKTDIILNNFNNNGFNDFNETRIIPFVPVKGKYYELMDIKVGNVVCDFKFQISKRYEPNEEVVYILFIQDGHLFKPNFTQSSCSIMKCGKNSLTCSQFIERGLRDVNTNVIFDYFEISLHHLSSYSNDIKYFDSFPMMLTDGGMLYVEDLMGDKTFDTNTRTGMKIGEKVYLKSNNNSKPLLGATLLALYRDAVIKVN
ncbi:hypothetical protein ABK040_001864 [Willaertia magna]